MSSPQMRIPAKIMLQGFFATPVAVAHLPNALEINQRLRKLILDRAESKPSIEHSNRGGCNRHGTSISGVEKPETLC